MNVGSHRYFKDWMPFLRCHHLRRFCDLHYRNSLSFLYNRNFDNGKVPFLSLNDRNLMSANYATLLHHSSKSAVLPTDIHAKKSGCREEMLFGSKLVTKTFCCKLPFTNMHHWYQEVSHEDVIKWKHFPHYWSFVRGTTGHWWIPLTKANDMDLWCFLWYAPEQTVEETIKTPSHSFCHQCNDNHGHGVSLIYMLNVIITCI